MRPLALEVFETRQATVLTSTRILLKEGLIGRMIGNLLLHLSQHRALLYLTDARQNLILRFDTRRVGDELAAALACVLTGHKLDALRQVVRLQMRPLLAVANS